MMIYVLIVMLFLLVQGLPLRFKNRVDIDFLFEI